MQLLANVVLLLSCLLCMQLQFMQVVLCEPNTNTTKGAALNVTTNNATAAKVYQIVQPQVKTTNATELTKEQLQELEKEKGKVNSSATIAAENTPRQRKVTNTTVVQLPLVNGNGNSSATLTPTTTANTTLNVTTAANTTTTAKPATKKVVADGVVLSDINNNTMTVITPTVNASVSGSDSITPTNSTSISRTNTTTTSTTTTTATTTSTTTTTTTPLPTKPKIAYSMDVHPEWEYKTGQEQQQTTGSSRGVASPVLPEPEPPLVQPSQELSNNNLDNRGSNEYIVPIVTVLLTVPLAIGVIISMYRRFRDFWSTRHYRRMDFLVDGMYND